MERVERYLAPAAGAYTPQAADWTIGEEHDLPKKFGRFPEAFYVSTFAGRTADVYLILESGEKVYFYSPGQGKEIKIGPIAKISEDTQIAQAYQITFLYYK